MVNPTAFYSSKELPTAVLEMVEDNQWVALANALRNGLPANLTSLGDVSLFERVLGQLEMARPANSTSSLEGPMELLERFIEGGLERGVLMGGSMTAVGLACIYGQWGWATHLIEAGFTVEVPSLGRSSVLHGLIDGRYQRALGLMDDDQEDAPRHKSIAVDTPLEYERVSNIIVLLASSGVELNAIDHYEDQEGPCFSPLGRAICVCDDAAVQGLILSGADLHIIQQSDGFSGRALDLAILMGSDEAVRMLLGAGAGVDANPAAEDESAELPLCLAAKMGRHELIPDIIEEMDPNDLQEASSVALHLAASANQLKALRQLFFMGVPLDVKLPPSGFTPLHQAALNGSTRVIDFMLRQGMSWHIESETGVQAGDILRQAHPDLAIRYELEAPKSNVSYLGIHRAKKR